MRLKFSNPLAFTPLPVTIVTTLVYLAVLIPVLVVHLTVPPAPSGEVDGVSVDQAWQDLQTLTNGFHPYNSRRNDEVRKWILQRIRWILGENGAAYTVERPFDAKDLENSQGLRSEGVTVFDDLTSNITFSTERKLDSHGDRTSKLSVYFEGTNVLVYIRGSGDDASPWWKVKDSEGDFKPSRKSRGGVLVNAHYDSVSTGFGATDDGVGVVTLLQLLRHFTSGDSTPKQGILLLFNNGEEDYLNGARAFTKHPLSKFAHTFLNLEGAGAGGRATLFRSTDTEVTRYYKNTKHPFGTVISSDGFKRGLVRSETDYVVFNGILGLRGLDVAFMAPRQRYHTTEDSLKYTSKESVWHMLSMALATVKGLTDTGEQFEGPSSTKSGKVSAGTGSNGVWFDVFGRGFAVFELKTLFALSLTLLIASPLALLLIAYLLQKYEKLYIFAKQPSDFSIPKLHAWRGFLRTPFVLVVSGAAVVGLALLFDKVNPHIVYSCPWIIWAAMMSTFYFISWFLLSSADFARPSALYRTYSFLWLYSIGWIILVAATVFEDRYDIAGVYPVMFYFAALDLAATISLLEFIALPKIAKLGNEDDDDNGTQADQPAESRSSRKDDPDTEGAENEEEEADENTPLFKGQVRSAFARYVPGVDEDEPPKKSPSSNAYGFEQEWSAHLPTWTWILQLLLVAPIVLILLGQAAVLLVSAMQQTAADGNPTFLVYSGMAILTILLLLPLLPFLHRHTHHLPITLLIVLIATIIYALLSFPFSPEARLKVRFIQSLDLASGKSNITLSGLTPYMPTILSAIPSAHSFQCNRTAPKSTLSSCTYEGLDPAQPGNSGSRPYSSWLNLSITTTQTYLPLASPYTKIRSTNSSKPGVKSALLEISPLNSRACKIKFDEPVSKLNVKGSSTSSIAKSNPKILNAGGSSSSETDETSELRLWSRTWNRTFEVEVEWKDNGSSEKNTRTGKVICLWSDANTYGLIPSLDEVWRFVPAWVGVTKADDGLIEGWKAFEI